MKKRKLLGITHKYISTKEIIFYERLKEIFSNNFKISIINLKWPNFLIFFFNNYFKKYYLMEIISDQKESLKILNKCLEVILKIHKWIKYKIIITQNLFTIKLINKYIYRINKILNLKVVPILRF